MNELKRKRRMISFRISDEEYTSLKLLSRNHGARSLSDFARLSMQRAAVADPAPTDLLFRLQTLDMRVAALESCIAGLVRDPRLSSQPESGRINP